MAKIHVIGLGPGPAKYMTLETRDILLSGAPVYLRTSVHPTVDELREWECNFTSFDSFYESATNFDTLYQKITQQLLNEVEAHGEIVYAVPGHPLVAESTVIQLLKSAEEAGVELEIYTAVSCLDVIFEALNIDPTDNLQILDALTLNEKQLDYRYPMLLTQVYSKTVANDLKLSLLERLDPEYVIQVVRSAGCDDEQLVSIPVEELDRLEWIDHLTSVYIPPTQSLDQLPPLERLRAVVAQLRNPDGGCAWDLKQTPYSLRKYVLEEAYEVVSAIEEGDPDALCEELGDLFLQVYLQAQVAQDQGDFELDEVADGISDKLIYRHPHVFETPDPDLTPEEVKAQWERLKTQEKADANEPSILVNLPKTLPALRLAEKLQHKVAQVGFDWPEVKGVLDKLDEEHAELIEAYESGSKDAICHELGDVLFTLANLARWHKLDPEDCLRKTNQRFVRRFQHMETHNGKDVGTSLDLDTWEKLWVQAKEQTS